MIMRRLAVVCAVVLASACQSLPLGMTKVIDPTSIEDGSEERRALNAQIYDRVVRLVRDNFYDRTFKGVDFVGEAALRRDDVIGQPAEAAFYRALNDLLDVLDDGHTSVAPPSPWRPERALAGSVLTLGLSYVSMVDPQDDLSRSYVINVQPGSPAAAQGVRVGWWIQSVDDQPLTDLERWEPDKQYVFRFVDREGGVHVHELGMEVMPIEHGFVQRRPDDVVVIRLDRFSMASAAWLEARVAEQRLNPPKAVVLDLRRNRGGDSEAMDDTLGVFFTERFRFGRFEVGGSRRLGLGLSGNLSEITRPSTNAWTGPLAVLQSNGSGSSSEILAATVQECGRGPIVGETSRGSVVVAFNWLLPDGGTLAVGSIEFRTRNGVLLEKKGVTPDVQAARTLEELRNGEDRMLEIAARSALQAPPGGDCRTALYPTAENAAAGP